MSTPGAAAPPKFPQQLASVDAKQTIRQRLSWVPLMLIPVLLFWSYSGALPLQPDYGRAGYITAAITLVLAVLFALWEGSRRKHRVVLSFTEDMIAVYKAGQFQYAFPSDQLVRYQLHPFNTGRLIFVTGVLALGSLVMAFLARRNGAWETAFAVLISLLLWGIFVSSIRSRVLSQWFYVPTGKGRSKLMFFKR